VAAARAARLLQAQIGSLAFPKLTVHTARFVMMAVLGPSGRAAKHATALTLIWPPTRLLSDLAIEGTFGILIERLLSRSKICRAAVILYFDLTSSFRSKDRPYISAPNLRPVVRGLEVSGD
jgi:hypothetical protein